MDSPPIYHLPPDALHQIFSSLSLRQITVCKSVSKLFHQTLSSQPFIDLISSSHHQLLALRPPHHSHAEFLHVLDPITNHWLRFHLSFLPFRSSSPVASSLGLVYFWGDSPESAESGKTLVVCNPLTRSYRVLPQLGSAWSKHGSVLVCQLGRVLVLSELATLYLSCKDSDTWVNFPSNLPSKPRSPVLVSNCVYALCDVGSPLRNQWKLYFCTLIHNNNRNGNDNGSNGSNSNINNTVRLPSSQLWDILEMHKRGDALDILKRPRLVPGVLWDILEMHKRGDALDILKRPRLVPGVGSKLLMVGGLKSSFSLHANCSTIVILRLDLETFEWDQAGRMPLEMYKCFGEHSSKFKVFGGGKRICFSGKRVGKLALWEEGRREGEWRWIEGLPRNGDWLCRGFMFEASLSASP